MSQELIGSRIPSLGKLEKVHLREVWDSEPLSFTPWLAKEENLALLGQAIGKELVLQGQEQAVGPFRADILCRDMFSEEFVLIENQIERTDHMHLGQLLTYTAGLHAATIVWVASRFTDEHRAALDWLNEATRDPFSFYGLEVELWRIGSSPAAPKFNVVSSPNRFVKKLTASKEAVSSNGNLYLDYWTKYSDFARQMDASIQPTKAQPQYWLDMSSFGLGRRMRAMASQRDKYLMVDFVIYEDSEKKKIRALEKSRSIIDQQVPGLIWNEKPGRKESTIELKKPDVQVNDPANWPEQHQWLLENIEKLSKALKPYLYSADIASDAEPAADSDLNQQ